VVVLDGVRRAPHRKRGQSRRINVCEDVWPEHSRFGTDGLSTPLDDGTRAWLAWSIPVAIRNVSSAVPVPSVFAEPTERRRGRCVSKDEEFGTRREDLRRRDRHRRGACGPSALCERGARSHPVRSPRRSGHGRRRA